MPSPTHFPTPRLRPTALACTSLILGVMLSGCGGGSSGDAVTQTDSGYQVASGVAQKGPLARGSWISINELNPNTLAPVGTSFNFEIRDDLGTFQPDSTVFTRPLLESTAMGYYFDELTGKVSTDVVILRGMSDLAVDRAVNINLLTDLANARTRALMTRTTSPLKFAAARAQAQREVLQALFLFNSSDLLPGGTTEPASFGELDLSKNRNADQVLAALSAVVTQIGVTGGGINQFINQFEADLLDDGAINNSPRFASSLTTKLNTAFKTVDFAKLAANLNTFYGTTRYTAASLSQWVDTSGGVDKVIDRYKSTAANIPVGTESKSVEYVAGTQDAGQCLSASTGKLYRNGAVVTGTVKAVKGDKLVIGLTGTTANAIISGFIQRSAPAAGVCPTVVPTSGLSRLAKHSATNAEVVNPNAVKTVLSYNGTVHALKGDGTVWTWGTSTRGVPTLDAQDMTDILYIDTKTYEGMKFKYKKSDGKLWEKTLGYDYTTSREISTIAPYTTPEFTNACKNLYTGDKAQIKSDGSLWMSGNNQFGQIGDGTSFTAGTPTNIGFGYIDIKCTETNSPSYSYENIYALKSDGSLWAWGRNLGQLGNASSGNFLIPTRIGTNYTKIQRLRSENPSYRGGSSISFPQEMIAQKSDGTLWYWGGEIDGDSRYTYEASPTAKLIPTKIGTDSYASFTSLEKSVFAMKSDNSLWAWGTNQFGQLGDGTKNHISTPKKIGDGFSSVSQSKYHTIALKKDGTLWAWGSNDYGQLGDGTKQPSLTPKLIGSGYAKVVAQENHTLAIKTDGSLWGWGQNAAGELGDGTTISSLAPKKIELR